LNWLSPASGTWSDVTKWSANPNAPNNGTPDDGNTDTHVGAGTFGLFHLVCNGLAVLGPAPRGETSLRLSDNPEMIFSIRFRFSFIAALLITCCALGDAPAKMQATLERISVSADGRKLVRAGGKIFTPWGFNYDRDYRMRLIEDYWVDEWETVAGDFREMKALGANIVRIHLSVSQFLETPEKGNQKNLAQLTKLVKWCEEIGIYLDVTGLGSYRKEAAPDWYVNTTEAQRWAIQAKFWDVVAEACGKSPAIAWFDLANEAAVPGEKQKPGEWMAGHLERYWYCQFITLDPAGRDRGDIARAWVTQMKAAIRKHDDAALITIGMLPFTSSPGQPSLGIDPPALKDLLDLICVHIYPKAPPFAKSLSLVEKFDMGKPLVIEEIFPLESRPEDLPAFFEASKKWADGWIGFYWGQTEQELAPSTRPVDVLTRRWLKVFRTSRPEE
jgi:hypothetical protein